MQKYEWEIVFVRNRNYAHITRYAQSETEAISDARKEFYELYGFWPNEPIIVTKVGEVEY